jgi:hypothetical protein
MFNNKMRESNYLKLICKTILLNVISNSYHTEVKRRAVSCRLHTVQTNRIKRISGMGSGDTHWSYSEIEDLFILLPQPLIVRGDKCRQFNALRGHNPARGVRSTVSFSCWVWVEPVASIFLFTFSNLNSACTLLQAKLLKGFFPCRFRTAELRISCCFETRHQHFICVRS